MSTDYRAYLLDMDENTNTCLSFVRLINELRHNPRILILSSGEDKAEEAEARKRGITLFLNKPVTEEEMTPLLTKEASGN